MVISRCGRAASGGQAGPASAGQARQAARPAGSFAAASAAPPAGTDSAAAPGSASMTGPLAQCARPSPPAAARARASRRWRHPLLARPKASSSSTVGNRIWWSGFWNRMPRAASAALRSAERVEPLDPHRAGIGGDQPGDQPQKRGLARPVAAQNPDPRFRQATSARPAPDPARTPANAGRPGSQAGYWQLAMKVSPYWSL
jgi:hypothetical protein